MKLINKNIVAVAALFIVMFFGSCKKDSYLQDGGTADPNTPFTTYDYLANHQYRYFDTTLLLIDHFNLKDSVNKAGTFFAFTDYSVTALMLNLNCTTLDQLYDSVSSKLLTQYMFGDANITLENAVLTPTLHANWAGDGVNAAVKKIEGSYGINLSSSNPVFNYYTLQYVSVNGFLDGSAGAPPNDLIDGVYSCQTSGIKTASGTTLHVLANTAILKKL